MPYIRRELRSRIDPVNCGVPTAMTSGDLNFQVTCLVDAYLKGHGLNYSKINEVVGVLECAKHELYRRVAAPYENKKIQENGDVYTVDRSKIINVKDQ